MKNDLIRKLVGPVAALTIAGAVAPYLIDSQQANATSNIQAPQYLNNQNPTPATYSNTTPDYFSQQSRDTTDYIPKEEIRKYVNAAFRQVSMPGLYNPDLVERLIFKESSGNRLAFFPKTGARGLMQLTFEAWQQINGNKYSENNKKVFNAKEWTDYISSVFNPEASILTGIKYLKWAYDFCKTNHENWGNLSDQEKMIVALAVYNEGPGKIRGIDWSRENPNYTEGVL